MPTELFATQAMGTRFELVLVGSDRSVLRAAGAEALLSIEESHERWSAFASDSVVSRINRAAGRSPVRVDEQTYHLLEQCEQIREASGGLFDITVGTLMERAGFSRSYEAAERVHAANSELEFDDAARTVLLRSPDARLDLGGIAKGAAVDFILEELRDSGVQSAFCHAGSSSIGAYGQQSCGRSWRVSVGEQVVDFPESGLCMSFSGHAEQGMHAIDPRTGHPSQNSESVSVFGPSATVCDAWSTVAMILGARPAGLPEPYNFLNSSLTPEPISHV